jgi:hypothetical protein
MTNLWNIGVARADITPTEPIALAGWAGRRISQGVTHPLWAKAIAFQDAAGARGVLVTTDLLGLSRAMSEELAQRAARKFGLKREQLIINSSHNHAGPVTGDLLHLYYDLNVQELKMVECYTARLLDEIESAIGAAIDALQPSTLSFEQGYCGFGVNRRRARPGYSSKEYSGPRELPQVVDQDVPVLTIRGQDEKIRAVVFGYACHPTSYQSLQLCGDWPGFAQLEIEKQFPDATALFVANCGGDINALPRFGRYHEELSEMYGKILAASVCNVVDEPMRPIESVLRVGFAETHLALTEPPSLDELKTRAAFLRDKYKAGVAVREVEHQMKKLQRGETLAGNVPYPIHAWQLGELLFLALSGEPVVDFSLRYKREYGNEATWVAGYCNELTSYIPSRRVLEEGGYEGTSGMMEYGWPSSYTSDAEATITATVESLIGRIRSNA